ncbi:CvpA family protein [Treponema sp.]|uniref:CvpA family protein n=1 Tax=Treponema sp. TaxID=166 RepID=UPI003F0D8D25
MMFPAVDIIFLLIVLLFAVLGTFNGFLNEIFGKAAPVVSAWVAFLFYGQLVLPIEKYIHIRFLSVIISFLLIFISSFIVMKLLQTAVKNIFGGEIFKDLDRILGFLFGILEGLVVVCLVMFVMEIQPWFSVEPILKNSFFFRIFSPIVSVPLQRISGAVENTSAAPLAIPLVTGDN